MAILQCTSPIDGAIFAERETLNLESAKAVVDGLRRAQPAWRSRPLEERISLVRAGIAQLGAMNDEIVPALAKMMGRPVRYNGEFSGVNERADYMADIAATALSPTVIEESEDFERRILREPHGAVLVVAPWNYPYMTAINTLVPALIAGNAVGLKHSTQTLLAGEHLAHAFHNAGIPEDVFANLFLDHETTARLIADRAFGFVNFTGSVGAGQAIERAAAGTFTGLGLELGGKDPGYVMDDADVSAAAESLIDGAMFNSGQCCCGIERIYVAERHFDDFVEQAIGIVSDHVLGNPLDSNTTLGPMAHARFARAVRCQTAAAIAQGAKPCIDTSKFADDGGNYLAPQILIDVTHDMQVMREESFGPVVGIMKVRNDEEALALINDSIYGLTASLWTGDPERAARFGGQIDTGTVFMNRADYLDPALCWSGCKDSGRGGALSSIGYANLTRPKSYHLKKL